MAEDIQVAALPANDDTAAASLPGDAIGYVTEIDGGTFAVRDGFGRVELNDGDPVFEGDRIETGGGAAIGIEFADQSVFALGADSVVQLDTFVYEGPQVAAIGEFGIEMIGEQAIAVLKGAFAFTSGQIAHAGDDAMTVSTPVGTIGVRGTTVVGSVGENGADTTISLLPDTDGQIGEIAVFNDDAMEFLFDAYQTLTISGAGSFNPPQQGTETDIRALYGDIVPTLTESIQEARTRAGDSGDDKAGDQGASFAIEKPEAGETASYTLDAGAQVAIGFDIADAKVERLEDAIRLTFGDGAEILVELVDAGVIDNGPLVMLSDGTLLGLQDFVQILQQADGAGDTETNSGYSATDATLADGGNLADALSVDLSGLENLTDMLQLLLLAIENGDILHAGDLAAFLNQYGYDAADFTIAESAFGGGETGAAGPGEVNSTDRAAETGSDGDAGEKGGEKGDERQFQDLIQEMLVSTQEHVFAIRGDIRNTLVELQENTSQAMAEPKALAELATQNEDWNAFDAAVAEIDTLRLAYSDSVQEIEAGYNSTVDSILAGTQDTINGAIRDMTGDDQFDIADYIDRFTIDLDAVTAIDLDNGGSLSAMQLIDDGGDDLGGILDAQFESAGDSDSGPAAESASSDKQAAAEPPPVPQADLPDIPVEPEYTAV